MSVVANVAINLDARGVQERLRQISAAAQATAQSFSGLSKGADQIKSAVERSKTSFARASEVQNVFSAKVRNTEGAIRAQIVALRDIQSRVQFNGALYQKAAKQIQEYEAVLAKTNQTQKNQAGSANILASSFGRLVISYAALRTAQESIQTGIRREESERRLTFLAKGYGEVAQAQELATRSGKRFGLSASESNQQFAQLYGRLRPLNVSLEDINTAFVGFNTAAKVSGATTAETAGALLQLTQALGSGVLRGQELNSVLEQAPGLVTALTKELNKPVSEIRKLAEEGEITSDVVIRALKRAGTEGADELAAAMNGPAQAIKNLQNEFENFQVAATQDLIPMVVEAMKGLREVLISLSPVIRGLGGIAAQTLETVADLINAATKPRATAAAIAIRGGRLPLAGFGGMSGAGELFKGTSGAFGTGLTGIKTEAAFLAKQRRQPVAKVLLDLMRNRLQRMEAPVQVSTPDLPSMFTSPSATGKKKTTKKTDAERTAERLKEEIRQSLELGGRLGVEFSRQVILLDTSSEIERKRLQIQYDFEDRAKQISELKNAEQRVNLTDLNNEIKRLETLKLQTEELKNQLEEYYKRAGLTPDAMLPGGAGAFRTDISLMPEIGMAEEAAKVKKELNDLLNPINQVKEAAKSIGDAFGTSFKGLASGAMTAQEALAGFFQSVADHFLDMAAQIIAKWIQMTILNSVLRLFPAGPATGAAASGGYTLPGGAGFVEGFSLPSLLPGRARGGSVSAGSPYMVGEQGPELFVPGRSGTIVPNNKMGGDNVSVVVNVDAKGSSVQGDDQRGNQLGRAISAAVQQELIKQKRPGGLLA